MPDQSKRNINQLIKTAMVSIVCLIFTFPFSEASTITNVSLSDNEVGLYDIQEISAIIQTPASNYSWPYDENPPVSIPPKTGITVDGLFSCDNWATTIVQPGFYFQEYRRQLVNGTGTTYTDEANVPVGQPCWRIRFAPTQIGTWRYKIRVVDADGTTLYPLSGDNTFQCMPSQNHGFMKVSPNDQRYFELSDGTPITAIGVYSQFHSTYEADSLLQFYGSSGIKLTRWWMNYREWQNPFGGGNGNPQWNFSLSLANTGGCKSNDRYCAQISSGRNTNQSVYLENGKIYKLTGYTKTVGVAGNTGTGGIAFIGASNSVAKQGDNSWSAFSINYTPITTGSYLVGCKHTGTAGTVYFDDFSLKASSDGGITWSGEYLSKGDFDWENYVDAREAWKVDQIFAAAKQNGIYLKTVITEKQDQTLGCIAIDGTTVNQSDGNCYASATHPSRWLQKAWWRYMAARWGSYTSMHSWEFCNEGDPFNGNHYNAADALASYIHSVDPNKALCSTSFWHSIPMDFWKTSLCDYIDIHEYIGPTTSGTGSHGPRFYAWYDSGPIPPISDNDGTIAFDSTISHTESRSLKLTTKLGTGNAGSMYTCPEYHVGINPSHTYTVRFWAKADNVSNPGGGLYWVKPGISIAWSKAFHENDWVGGTSVDANLGTYDWYIVEKTGIRPPVTANTANVRAVCPCNQTQTSNFWVDNVQFIDETTGKNLFVDGDFEDDRIDYDTAIAVKKYGVLLNSYGLRVGKTAVWGEAGIRGPNIYGNPYKGYTYTEENQQLVDDTDGIYIKKMVWAHVGPDNPYMFYWWTDNIKKKGLWRYFKAFQNFMSGIPVSNGKYVDIVSSTSNNKLRAWGQKDLPNNKAHIWIDNIPYNWKNVVDGVQVPAVTGTITIAGFKDGGYKAEWWDTSTGAITSTDDVQCTAGNIVLSVQNLQSDIACKIYPTPADVKLRILVPSNQVSPGEVITVTVEYTNTSATAASNVVVSTRIPAEMDYVAGSAEKSGGRYALATKTISWTVANIAAGQTGTKTYQAKVK